MKNYYLCSEEVVKAFPDLVKSKSFISGYEHDKGKNYYIVITPDFQPIQDYFDNKNPDGFWICEIIDSQLEIDEIDFFDSNECEANECSISIEDCKEMGIFAAIEQFIGVTKEQNIAYAIYKICEREELNPIEFANKL